MMTVTQTLCAAKLGSKAKATLSEGLRLSLIVGSLSFVILAGQFAQSRNNELTSEAAQTISASAIAAEEATTRSIEQAKSQRKLSSLEKFATVQLRSYSELLDGLTERAEMVLSTRSVSNSDLEVLRSSLRDLDANLMMSREALENLQAVRSSKNSRELKFAEEDLRGSLLNLQEAASQARGHLINLDR